MRSGTELRKTEGFFLAKIQRGDSSKSKSYVSVGEGKNGKWAGIEFSRRMKYLNRSSSSLSFPTPHEFLSSE